MYLIFAVLSLIHTITAPAPSKAQGMLPAPAPAPKPASTGARVYDYHSPLIVGAINTISASHPGLLTRGIGPTEEKI